MKKMLHKVMGMALALCMAAVMFCGSAIEAQAAGKKSFTKNVTVEGGQCVIEMEVSKNTVVTVNISSSSKKKDLKVQAIIAGVYEGFPEGGPHFVNLDSKNKKDSFTVKLNKGRHQLYISNYTINPTKVKVKVSARAKALSYIGMEQRDDMA